MIALQHHMVEDQNWRSVITARCPALLLKAHISRAFPRCIDSMYARCPNTMRFKDATDGLGNLIALYCHERYEDGEK